MTLLLMALMATVTVHETTLDTDLLTNSTEEEWVAPGYRVAERVTIDPLDYGTPQYWNEDEGRIGFQSFFVDTPQGEKWRIVIAYDMEIVVLQEDAESSRFQVDRSIEWVRHSKDGRYVLAKLQEEEQTFEEIVSQGSAEPENRVVLIDIDTGERVTRTGITNILYIGGNGYMVAFDNDSIRFYDERLGIVGTAWNCMTQMGSTPTAHATDGSLMVRIFSEAPRDSISILRAYDIYGNVLWDSDPRNVGWPAISEHGEYVFVLGIGRLMCLDGATGELLWEEPIENEGRMFKACRRGASCMFYTDVTPAESRSNPDRERVLYTISISGEDRNVCRASYFLGSISITPVTANRRGYSLWKLGGGSFYLCLFKNTGELLYSWGRHYGYNYYLNNGLNRNIEPNLGAYSVDSSGLRFVWIDSRAINIVTLEKEGASS